MSKPWAGEGLDEYSSWIGPSVFGEGLIYRGDSDFEQLGPKSMLTVLEFKKMNEKPVSRGQLAWLRARARQDRTEVRVVREMSTDYEDMDRPVWVWNPIKPVDTAAVLGLSYLAAWVDSRAYRPPKP